MTSYTAPLRDMHFVLDELVGLDAVARLPGRAEIDAAFAEVSSELLEALDVAVNVRLWKLMRKGHPWRALNRGLVLLMTSTFPFLRTTLQSR